MKEEFSAIIKSDGLKDVSLDIVESILDGEIDNDLIREIPIIKTLIAFRKTYTSYSDRIFIKKAMNVLLELGDISWKQRIELTNDLDDNDSSGAEKILLAIDKLESYSKCKVFGRLCRLKALNRIDKDEFLRLNRIIQNSYLDDLLMINDFLKGEKHEIWEGDYHQIISLGLIFQEPSEQEEIKINHHRYDEYDPEVTGGKITFNYMLSYEGELLSEFYDDLFPEDKKKAKEWRERARQRLDKPWKRT